MAIVNKDFHAANDPNMGLSYLDELKVQQMANKEGRERDRLENLTHDQAMLEQIKDSLDMATQKKQHLLYK